MRQPPLQLTDVLCIIIDNEIELRNIDNEIELRIIDNEVFVTKRQQQRENRKTGQYANPSAET